MKDNNNDGDPGGTPVHKKRYLDHMCVLVRVSSRTYVRTTEPYFHTRG